MGRGIVIAGDIVDLLAAMMFEDRVLVHDLAPLLVLRGIPESRIVAEIERDIPLDRGAAETPALLRGAQGFGERFRIDRRRPESDQPMLDAGACGLVGSDVAIADDPEIEPGAFARCRRALRGGGDSRRRQAGDAGFDQHTAGAGGWLPPSSPGAGGAGVCFPPCDA